jgi:hypothetical protein
MSTEAKETAPPSEKVEDKVQDEQAEDKVTAEEQVAVEEQMIERQSDSPSLALSFQAVVLTFHSTTILHPKTVKPVTIRLPSPTFPQTISSTSSKTQTPSHFIIHPQPTETIQDIRATLLEWTGGYWLGPYSLRIPASSAGGKKQGGGERGRLCGKGKEGVEIREGERLSDWFGIGEVFGHLDEKDETERVLVVQRGTCRVCRVP